ncbi:MAG: hypothetical protein IJK41_04335 [Muribaculaceae bacterium]|nr:hypothetical protein [Muribaculaceae bacterium]
MKQNIFFLLSITFVMLFTACAPVEDDIFTTACITVTAEGNESITSVQAQVKLTNVNTRQVTTVADFNGTSVTVELLRGAYQIDIEGVATCQSPGNSIRMRQFRCQSDYEEFISRDINEVTLKTIFLD